MGTTTVKATLPVSIHTTSQILSGPAGETAFYGAYACILGREIAKVDCCEKTEKAATGKVRKMVRDFVTKAQEQTQ